MEMRKLRLDVKGSHGKLSDYAVSLVKRIFFSLLVCSNVGIPINQKPILDSRVHARPHAYIYLIHHRQTVPRYLPRGRCMSGVLESSSGTGLRRTRSVGQLEVGWARWGRADGGVNPQNQSKPLRNKRLTGNE